MIGQYPKSGPSKKYLYSKFYILNSNKGFTLIEIAITVAIVGVLLGIIIFAINPAQYLARGRDTQRKGDSLSILSVIGQRAADNKGIFETNCAAGVIPATTTKMATGVGNYDIGPCLVPAYLSKLPFDPTATGAHWTSTTDYDTGYNLSKDVTTGRITISAPSAELEVITYTR